MCSDPKLVAMFGNSVSLAIMVEHPEHAWQPWKMKYLPQLWAKKLEQQAHKGDPVCKTVLENIFESLSNELGLTPDFQNASWREHLLHKSLQLAEQKNSYWSRILPHLNLQRLLNLENAVQPLDTNAHFQLSYSSNAHAKGHWLEPQNRRRYLDYLMGVLNKGYAGLYDVYYAYVLRAGGMFF